MNSRCTWISVLTVTLLLVVLAQPVWGRIPGREQEPVILAGADLSALFGFPTGSLVGFRREGAAWIQVAVQVDQRAVIDLYTVVNQDPGGVELLTYTDPGTFVGSDPDPLFDGNDELVMLAGSAGDDAAGAPPPAGVRGDIRLRIRLRHPLTGELAWLYVFVSDSGLDPSAGVPPVGYEFVLLSGDYKTTYNTGLGLNPEASTVVTPAYTGRFSDRWIRDGMEVHSGLSTGVDILDRHRSQFSPGNCSRTEDTFSNGNGAFIVNRSGPVRALRGYMGANSGPTTYRIHAFYPEREVIRTALRVHEIIGVMDFMDYAPAAIGMSYRNNMAPSGVTVDGGPDAVPAGVLTWEMITGNQGTVAQAHRYIAEQAGLNPTSYYADEAAPAFTPCAGDGSEYGASGPWFDQPVLNTDPALEQQVGELYRFELIRTLAYGPPDQPTGFAENLAGEIAAPLEVTVTSSTLCPDGDHDDYAVCDEVCDLPPAGQCGDCDDGAPGRNPGAPEVCNDVDDDCDGSTDEGVTETFYRDLDVDGYGDPATTARACSRPDGYVSDSGDCDDDDLSVHPGAAEVCNGIDDDCDGSTDEGVAGTFYQDADGDGYGDAGATTRACSRPDGYVADGADCNDGDASVHPGAAEVCNGADDDCDGSSDEGVTTTFYRDSDGDGYGDAGVTTRACSRPGGYVANPEDCNDGNASIYPGAVEQCRNGIDDDCDALVDAADPECPARQECPDADGDQYVVCDGACSLPSGTQCGDCNDGDAGVKPEAAEVCNGVDDDCDGSIDEAVRTTFHRDSDGDGYGHPGDTAQACSRPGGYVSNGEDCNDGNPSVHPGVIEVCNGIDDDCDASVDEDVTATFHRDSDGDGYGHPGDTIRACSRPGGYVSNGQDCNDGNPSVHPGAVEVCNGIDDDCDASVDEGVTETFHRDFDGDGYGDPGNATPACSRPDGHVVDAEDCNDSDATINPGAAEQCNNRIDDDCDALVDEADAECQPTQDCPDVDGDGYVLCDGACAPPAGAQCGECNDGDAGISPGVPDLCNGLDDDCSDVPDDPRCTEYDTNGDHRIDARELSWIGRAFGLCSADPAAEWWRPVDYDGSGCIDGDDLAILANLWGLVCQGDLLICP